ncbi:MAG: hypothetical protein IT537_08825 [Hyphomicrobiales bacterium]|nr:hypothetical protein [Hyphomicrobiales bacterium]
MRQRGAVAEAQIVVERAAKTPQRQQVVVENKSGANNQIAAEYVTKAPPDGHTLLIGPETTVVVNPSLYESPPAATSTWSCSSRWSG